MLGEEGKRDRERIETQLKHCVTPVVLRLEMLSLNSFTFAVSWVSEFVEISSSNLSDRSAIRVPNVSTMWFTRNLTWWQHFLQRLEEC